jgi:hypothetical protein
MNKTKYLRIIKFVLILLLIPFMYQCMHDEFDFNKLDDEMEIVVGVLAPVAYGSLNINDLISEIDNDGYFSTDPDGLLMLSYSDTIGSFVAEDLLVIPSQSFFEYFIESDFGFPVAPPAMTFPIDRKVMFPFTFENGERLDSMQLDAGSLVFDISSSFQHQAQVELTITNLTQNGVPFSETFNISDESGTYSASIPFTLDGYTIELQDSVGNDTMFFPVEFHVEIYTNGINGISSSDQIEIDAGLSDLDFDAIFGYIGNYELIGENGTLDLGFFDNPFDGTIEFANPQLNINISNSYGLPAEININRLTGFDQNGDSIQMTYDPVSTSTFRYAFPKLSEYGQTKDTTISINRGNSSIPEFLAFLPSSIEYNIDAASNPDGNIDYNFVSDDSKVDISLEFLLPLEFEADSFAFADTIEDILDDGWYDDADIIDQINIMLEVTNGMPLEIDFQVIFMDSLYNAVDSLFADGEEIIIPAAIVDPATYDVTSSNVKTSLIQYMDSDIEKIKNARHAIIRAGLQTSNVGGTPVAVKFFDYYTVDFNLSVGVNVKANTNDL